MAKQRKQPDKVTGNQTEELRLVQEEAEKRAVELDAALSSIADGVVIFSLDRKAVRINPMASFLLHWSPGSEGRPLEELIQSLHAKDAEGRAVLLEDFPVTRAYRDEIVLSQVLSIEPDLRHSPRWVSCSAAPIRILNGKMIGVAATFTDVTRQSLLTEKLRKAKDELELRVRERTTEVEKAKDEIQRQNALFEIILEQAADGIFVTDQSGRILLVNEAAKRMAIRDSKDHSFELLESYWGEAYDPDGRLIPVEEWSVSKALRGETTIAREIRMMLPDGSHRDIQISAAPLSEPDGTIIGTVSIFSDITARKRSQEALKRSERELRKLSSRLLSAQEDERKRIAVELHDSVSSSLSAIKMSLEILFERSDQDSKAAQSIEDVILITQQTMDEIRRIMNALRPSMLDDLGLVATIRAFCRSFQSIHKNTFVEQSVEVQEGDIPESLRTVIYRIVQEAFNNIAKYSRAEFVELSLRKRGDILELTVADNGEGFDLDAALAKEDHQKGFGLSSMRERTELSGGWFLIESVPGEGTTIRASWNLAALAQTAPSPSQLDSGWTLMHLAAAARMEGFNPDKAESFLREVGSLQIQGLEQSDSWMKLPGLELQSGSVPQDGIVQMLRLIIDNIPQFVFWKNTDSIYLGCNKNFARVAGVGEPRNIIGKTDFDLAWTWEEAEFYRSWDRRVMAKNKAEYHIIESQRQADGKQAWLDTNKVPLRDPSGQVIGILGTYQDITERKQAEEALLESESSYRELVQNANCAIVRWKSDGTIAFFNEYAQELFGYRTDEAIGKHISIILPGMESSGIDLATFVQDVVKHPDRYLQHISKHICRNGRHLWMTWTNKPIFDETGSVTHILSIGIDITKQKQLEEAVRAKDAALHPG